MNKNMWRRLENSVSPQDSITGGCVHEAAHAVVAMALGLGVTKIWTDIENTPHSLPDGETRAGGSCHFDSIHCVHVGAIAVYAGPIANGKILRHHGYSETVASAVESMCASTDNQVVCDWMRDEKFVWPRQARIDAERFVSDPVVWDTILRVAGALLPKGELTPDELAGIVGDASKLTDLDYWKPDYEELKWTKETSS